MINLQKEFGKMKVIQHGEESLAQREMAPKR